ncbi:MAG: nitrate- and nitrite sensing domain-containing protein, partial [Pseudomonadota bacterium]
MRLIANLGMRTKLALLAGVPVLLLLWFSADSVLDRARQAQSLREVRSLVEMSVRVGALVHELQRERGMTVGFVGSGGRRFTDELPVQRSRTDRALQAFEAGLDSFDARRFGEGFAAGLAQARSQLRGLGGLRQGALALALPAPEAAAQYTGFVAALLGVAERIPTLSPDGEVAREAGAYVALLKAKEHAGIERAMLTAAFTADRFAGEEFVRFVANAAAQDTWLAVFRAYADKAAHEVFEQRLAGGEAAQVGQMKAQAIRRAAQGALGIAPDDWFKTASVRIDRLKDVEDALAQTLLGHAATREAEAREDMRLAVGLALLGLLTTLVLSWAIARQVVRSMALALRAADRLAGGDLTVRIDQATRDETGRLLQAMGAMAGKLREVISEVRSSSSHLASASEQVSSTAQSLSQGATEQAASVEELSATAEQASASVAQNT